MFRQTPIRALPPGYHEALRLTATEGRMLLWLNLASLLPLATALVIMGWWWALVRQMRGPYPNAFWDSLSWVVAVIGVILIMIVGHEWIHGLAIQAVGHRPRYGVKLSQGVVFATTDSGLFRRGEFIFVALAPLVVITLVGMALMAVVPDALGYYVGLVVVLNAGGAVADIWMAWVVGRCPSDTIVRDEADSVRIYKRGVQAVEA